MRAFIQRHLDPATRLGEAMFGLIMALGITGAVRVGTEEATHHQLLVAVFGCNLAWGIVDGVMFALLALFERARKNRIIRNVANTADEEAALRVIDGELGDRLEPLTTPEERATINKWVLDLARRSTLETPRLCRDDVLGGIAVALLIIIVTLPILLPFVLIPDLSFAVRLSNFIALGQLFWIGIWWARIVGADPWRISCGVTGVGVLMVLLTIALGG